MANNKKYKWKGAKGAFKKFSVFEMSQCSIDLLTATVTEDMKKGIEKILSDPANYSAPQNSHPS